ncbi:hypothetical protein QE152_g23349 [Popillia japonica]|uniref:HTH psq-type domain-containing protein n=1 Tax=Popillia japonica TaxID=7064 RepID=A0AAW1KH61_POPJA
MSDKRKCLINTKNVKILKDVDTGIKKKDIAVKYSIAPNSLSTISEHRNSILQQDDTTNKEKRYRTYQEQLIKEEATKFSEKLGHWIRSKHWMAG